MKLSVIVVIAGKCGKQFGQVDLSAQASPKVFPVTHSCHISSSIELRCCLVPLASVPWHSLSLILAR